MSRICVFRVDASVAIATGHLMRCLVLAKALHALGYECHFICRDFMPLDTFFKNTPFVIQLLPKPQNNRSGNTYQDWLQVTIEQDIAQTLSVMPSCGWLVVDHYALDKNWTEAVRHRCSHVFVLDDLANRSHQSDILLDQNFYLDANKRYDHLIPESCEALLGLDYVLLQEKIKKSISKAHPRQALKRVLVHFGGVDKSGETLKALQALTEVDKTLTVDVVVGVACPHKLAIQDICEKHSWKWHCQIDYIDELILTSDLALGAGGVALWERMALGLPTVASCIADNQGNILEDLSHEHLIHYLGPSQALLPEDYRDVVNYYLHNPAQLRSLSQNGLGRVDGQGVDRVLKVMQAIEEK